MRFSYLVAVKSSKSEAQVTSTFMAEKYAKQESSIKQAASTAYFLTLKIGPTCSSEISIYVHWITWHYAPHDSILQHITEC
jgi:hypothetical protein